MNASRELPLSDAVRVFFGRLPPRILLVTWCAITAIRLAVGGFTWWDLLPVGLVIVLQPFVEWAVHVYVLHARPLPLVGWRLRGHAHRHHEAHHRAPRELRYVVMPLPAMAIGSAIHIAAWWLVCPTVGSWITGLWLVSTTSFLYEWVHFLVHTDYRPTTAWLRRLRRHHLLHHYKNDAYWLGVTRLEADRVLGTSPEI